MLEESFRELGITYRVLMESSNVELSSVYVEMGLGISFATVVRDLPALRHRRLAFVPMGQLFEPDYIAVIMRKDKVLASYKSAFLEFLLEDGGGGCHASE
jgi:DNA-binding transcriptional LysR family regulator